MMNIGDKLLLKQPEFTVIINRLLYVILLCCRCGKNIAFDDLVGIGKGEKYACLDCLEKKDG
jgi:hypothetical protein